MSTKHTQQPWFLDNDAICDGMGNCIAKVAFDGDDGWHGSLDEAKANARLIAAAPELLEALEEMLILAENERVRETNYAMIKARAAVSRARQ